MAYPRRYPRRKPGRKSRNTIRKSKRVNVLALAKKVNTLTKVQDSLVERIQYTVNWDENISSNYFAVSLTVPPTWNSVFGESDNVLEAQKINITKLNVDWLLQPGRESALIDYSVFLVSARTNKVYRETSALTAFQNNPAGQMDYTDAPITFMNPKRFKIWKVWRVQTSGITTRVSGSITPDVNVVNALKAPRRHMSMPFKRYIQNTTAQQSWKVVQDVDIPISASLALIFFNNNSSVDVENPNCQGTALFSCYV